MKTFTIKIFTILAFGIFSCTSSSTKENPQVAENPQGSIPNTKGLKTATFASGCFWCMEGVFESVKGVKEAVSGYSGGKEKNPTYHQVGSGSTGHAESVQVYYDSTVVDYATLVKVYFASEDPVQVNGQGPDHGSQYRSVIFYNNQKEKQIAENYIQQLNKSKTLSGAVAAQVVPFEKFWMAEGYHQNYISLNPNEPYVQNESIPRIKRFQSKYPELIKPEKLLK
jgi:peptide-methionine (S)-S-oxide reductase